MFSLSLSLSFSQPLFFCVWLCVFELEFEVCMALKCVCVCILYTIVIEIQSFGTDQLDDGFWIRNSSHDFGWKRNYDGAESLTYTQIYIFSYKTILCCNDCCNKTKSEQASNQNHQNRNEMNLKKCESFSIMLCCVSFEKCIKPSSEEEKKNKQTHSFIQIQSWIVFFSRIDIN